MTSLVNTDHGPVKCIDCPNELLGIMSITVQGDIGLAWMCQDCMIKRGLPDAKRLVREIAAGRRWSK